MKINSSFGAEKGQCAAISQHVYDVQTGFGRQMRLCTGWTDKKIGHQWAEYFQDGKWRLWDSAHFAIGKSWFTAEETGYVTFRCSTCGEVIS